MTLKPKPHVLKERLRAAGLSQLDAASFCGVSYAWMRGILSGHHKPSETVAMKLAELEELIDIAD